MYLSSLKKEKASVKLLYLFEPSFLNQIKIINESENAEAAEKFSKTFIRKILDAVGKFSLKFGFILVIALLLVLITIEYDIFMLIAKAMGMAVITPYLKSKSNKLGSKAADMISLKFKQDATRISKILTDNGYTEIDFADTEKYLYGSCIDEEGRKIAVRRAIINLSKSKNRDTAKEAKDIFDTIIDTGKGSELRRIKDNFSVSNWFGFKNILTYLETKAKTIQGYLSSLLKIIISIFSSKNLNEGKKIIKKQLKKIKFFNENILNKKNEINIFYNENIATAISGKRNYNFIANYLINDKKITINTINNTINSDDENIIGQIFQNKNLKTKNFAFKPEEYEIIKSFIKNEKTNNDEIDTQNIKNADVKNNKNTIEKTNTLSSNQENNEKNDLTKLDQIDAKKPSVFGLKLINSMINSSISKYLIIGLIVVIAVLGTATTMGGSAAAEKAKLAAEASAEAAGLSAEAIAEAGQKAAETAMNEAKGGNFIFFIQKCIKWLGWPASLGASLTYASLKGYMEKLTAGDISKSIENVEKNEEVKNTFDDGIKKVEKIIKKDEKNKNKKNEGFLSKTFKKVKNIFGSKKETTNDSYQYIRNKTEILYNEDYIMNEYFKIENKIKRSHS